MDKVLYAQFRAVEHQHWWFVGRRMIVDDQIRRLGLPRKAYIYEAGCGTGGNLGMLARHGTVFASEPDLSALEVAIQQQQAYVKPGSLPDHLPFADQQYHLIVMLDVLEHLDEDRSALERLYPMLKPGGTLLITVPAFQFLWSYHDQLNQHKRRYRADDLKHVVSQAGYEVTSLSYFNFFLFPIASLVRLLSKLLPPKPNPQGSRDLTLPAPLINQLMTQLFASERFLLRFMQLPFGVSLLLRATKVPNECSPIDPLLLDPVLRINPQPEDNAQWLGSYSP
jgi:SAM-dependent methyltransferase